MIIAGGSAYPRIIDFRAFREIAERIHVGVKSVETYRSRFARKLDLHRRADLIRYALQRGLLTPEEVVP